MNTNNHYHHSNHNQKPVRDDELENSKGQAKNYEQNHKNEQPAENKESQLDICLKIIKELEEEKKQLKEQSLRIAAEMENLRRRTANDIEKAKNFSISEFARDLLPVADNLQRALAGLQHTENQSEAVQGIISGIKLTQKAMEDAFAKNQVIKQNSVGKVFNPNLDKVVQEREDNSVPSGTVLEEWQAGYIIKDRVLREAIVIVAKNTENTTTDSSKGAENNPSTSAPN